MRLALDRAQALLARTAADFAHKSRGLERLRELRNRGDELGYSPTVWREMAELGWTGIPIHEADGGLGLGLAEVVLISEALGQQLAPEPFLSSVVMAGRLIARTGSQELRTAWLPDLIEGSRRLALAHQEPQSRYQLERIVTRAEPLGASGGYRLFGEKTQVIDGHLADGWIVPARTSRDDDEHGITLFVVEAGTPGVSTRRQWRVDSRNVATLDLAGVEVDADAILGEVGRGLGVLRETIDAATVALCGEMVGGMGEALRLTLGYLNEREQFGSKIGSFQALKHRAAKMFIEVELARSTVMAAARALDEGRPDAAVQVSNAKARCSDAFVLVTNEALQMHGGIGMTDEHDVGLYLKRARVAAQTFGDAAYHRDRFATVQGF